MPAASTQSISSVRTKKMRPPDFTTSRSGGCARFRLQILHHGEEAFPEIAGALAFEPIAGTLERAKEPRAVERLQQVVERMDLERLQRVLVVGRREDDERYPVRGQRANHAEAIHDRDLDVEEDQLGLEPLDGRERLRAVGALAHHLDVGLLLQQREHALSSHRLIVHNQGANLRHVSAPPGEVARGAVSPVLDDMSDA